MIGWDRILYMETIMKVTKRSGKGCVDIDGETTVTFNSCYGLNKTDNGRLIASSHRLIVFVCTLHFGISFHIDLHIFRL